MRAPYPTAQLVQLGEPEFVRPLDNDGVGIGYIDAGLDNRGADQNMVLLVIKGRHHLLQLPLPQLAMSYSNPQFRQ